MSFRPGDTVLVESTGMVGTASSMHDDEVVVENDSIERVNKEEIICVSGHLQHDRWRLLAGSTDPTEILEAWRDAVDVYPPHGLDADEVRYVESVEAILLRKDCELVTAIDATTCKTELKDAINRVT